MNSKKKNAIILVIYFLCLIFYIFGIVKLYKFLFNLHYYFLFVTIPILFLFVTLCITTIFKIIFSICEMTFGVKTDEDVKDFLISANEYTTRICKYVLIGIFMALLFSLMVLDIILCVNKGKYVLLSLSIVVWILLYYLLFTSIVKLIKREIRI